MNSDIRPATSDTSSRAELRPSRPRRVVGIFPLVLGFVSGIVLCGGGIVAATLLHGQPPQSAMPSPQPAASTICDTLLNRDYAGLFALLSSAQRSTGTSEQFAASQRQLDIAEGATRSCKATVSVVDGQQASVVFVVSRAVSGGKSGTARMVYEQGAWRLDEYDARVV